MNCIRMSCGKSFMMMNVFCYFGLMNESSSKTKVKIDKK